MNHGQVRFRVTRLEAEVPEGVPIQWQGRTFSSGPLQVELDEEAPPDASQGTLNYDRRRAEAAFHVRLKFPGFTALVEDLGLDPALGEPLRGVLASQGDILDDHSFALSGRCELQPHALFEKAPLNAAVLPGH